MKLSVNKVCNEIKDGNLYEKSLHKFFLIRHNNADRYRISFATKFKS